MAINHNLLMIGMFSCVQNELIAMINPGQVGDRDGIILLTPVSRIFIHP